MENNKKMRVEQFYNKNQFVIFDGCGGVTFQSYDSTAAHYDRGAGLLTLYGDIWDYSATTRKHFYLFIADYCRIELDSKNKRVDFAACIAAGKLCDGIKIEVIDGGRG